MTSDEPDNSTGDGNTALDMAIVDATTVQLRVERSGNQDGRVPEFAVASGVVAKIHHEGLQARGARMV